MNFYLLKINAHKNRKIKISAEIIKFTNQMISKSINSNTNTDQEIDSQLEDSIETKIVEFHLVF